MAQLPASMRRKRAAITSIHEKPPTRKQNLPMPADGCCWLLPFSLGGRNLRTI